MERETIEYRGKKYNRLPNSKRRQHRVYFWRHDKWKSSPFALHRQIYIYNFGEIPKGYVIHHKDENTLNNKPSNLVAMSKSEHMRLHSSQPHRIERTKDIISRTFHSEEGKQKARDWHKSKEGHEWHVEHAKKHPPQKNKSI